DARHETPGLLRSVRALARQKDGIGRYDAAFRLASRFLRGGRAIGHLLDLKHCGGLHDVLHSAGIVDARELHKNLILPEPMFLNRGLADPESIDAIADGI